MNPLEFTVRGLPVPQGSARAFVAGGKARIATDANRTGSPLGAWRTAIASACSEAMGQIPPFAGPVSVAVTFVFPRPKSHYLPVNRQRLAPELRLDAARFHSRKPDTDKLLRALFDAITTIAIVDDSQVARVVAQKLYEDEDLVPGAAIRIVKLQEGR